MHTEDRWRAILTSLATERVTPIELLADRLNVSSATIRRDIKMLDEIGRLRRVRGGAMPVTESSTGPVSAPSQLIGQEPYSEAEIRNVKQKRAIGKAAVAYCDPNEAIIIDGGSTTKMLADMLPNEPYQILTTSLPIIQALLLKSRVKLLIPGGEVFREQNILLSPYEDGLLDNFSAAKILMGAQAITAGGLMQTDPLLVQAERRLIDRADKIIVLADASKFTARAGLSVCSLSRINTVITNDDIPAAARRMLGDAGVELVTVAA